MPPLDILSCGAVTSVGLDAFQTAAAFRARIAGFQSAIPLTPPLEPLQAARVPARATLRRSPFDWHVNLAARGIRQCIEFAPPRARLGLVLASPERVRNHPALAGGEPELLRALVQASGCAFAEATLVKEPTGGGAAAIGVAQDMLRYRTVEACLVGGADSLINGTDVQRLRRAGRILEPENPQGLIPGEGAGFVLVAPPGHFSGALARICGIGKAIETNHVGSESFSQGRAFATALQSAIQDSDIPESSISFRVSTLNGEHYAVWESMFFATRFYRTRREHLPIWYTASSIGETGCAAGTIALILAAFGIAGGYAPGPYAMCESASETGLREACLIGPAPGNAAPPFRPEGGAALHVLSRICATPD